MSSLELRIRFAMGIIVVCAFMGGVFWMNLEGSRKSKEYPDMETSKERIQDFIKSVYVEHGYASITFGNGIKRTIYWARNKNYAPSDLVEFCQPGDHIFKKAGNGTITLTRKGQSYTFVLGKAI
jgi:hypothetical protein